MTASRTVTVVLTCALGALFAACSSTSTPGTGTSSSSSSSASSGGASGTSGTSGTSGESGTSGSSGTSGASGTSGGASGTSGTSGGDPVAACISTCESMHPQGVMIGKGIDTCWSANCQTQCNGIGTGSDKPPTTGDCKNPVSTPAVACSQCTVDKCCAAWDACFSDPDCSALNTCSIACYK